ncbi:MAG: hypothetical protein C0498_13840, partial [Anaerolinea sp.]|nr:hypothetical protein [Anaerolinea sp.]
NTVAFGQGVAEGVWDFGVGTVEGTVALAGATVGAGSCALNGACRDAALASASRTAAAIAADPLGSAGRAAGTVVGGVTSTVGGALTDVGSAWSTGNFRRLGRLSFDAAATVATVVSVAGAVRALPTAARAVAGRGGQAVSRSVSATTTAERATAPAAKSAISAADAGTARAIPNPWGRRGSPMHQAKIAEVEARLEGKGWQTVSGGSRPEAAVRAPGGGVRYPDLVVRKGTKAVAIQVGRTTRTGVPVARERTALVALRATKAFDRVLFVRYR